MQRFKKFAGFFPVFFTFAFLLPAVMLGFHGYMPIKNYERMSMPLTLMFFSMELLIFVFFAAGITVALLSRAEFDAGPRNIFEWTFIGLLGLAAINALLVLILWAGKRLHL
ncbi:MAG: hypothetical protein JWP13_305 [Candidatus Saccharibacteria bacterium]|nr:hypothetical protein [Candidatus Saccharibacteria bacterium]